MALELGEGLANVRWVFSCDGVADEMSFACAVMPTTPKAPGTIAGLANDAFVDCGLGDPLTILQSWTYLGTRVTANNGAGPELAEHNEAIAGELTGESLLVNTAVLVRKVTSLGGRKNRGRMFVPPFFLNESAVQNSGVIESATFGPVQSLFAGFHGNLEVSDIPPFLLHSDPLAMATHIESFVVQNLCATQRRRMR